MSERAMDPTPASAREPDRADAEALLHPDERLLWFWNRTASRRLGPRAEALLVMALMVVLAGYTVLLWQNDDPSWRQERSRELLTLAVPAAFLAALWRVAGWHRGADEIETWFGKTAPARAYGLTQHRLLMLSRSLRWEVPLEPGEPMIQYGSFRIDRPDRRGERLIHRIPKPEQQRLFAALQLAQALREARAPVLA